LDLSLKRLCLPAAPRGALVGDTRMVLQDVGAVDAALRLYVTASGTRLVTLAPPPVRPQPASLEAQPAPWIRPLGTWGPAGAKTMSYAPNMAATRAAVRAGADDALLVSLEGWVLEGPTFAVLWVAGGTLRAPAPDLGIVDSISRRTVLELATAAGIPVGEGRWRLADLEQSDEVMACSSVRPLVIVGRIGERRLDGPTPVRDRLAAALDDARRSGGDR
jgi:branched-subunit amino acid aminotransferase/4-amino-4-deoxychorismate lyase